MSPILKKRLYHNGTHVYYINKNINRFFLQKKHEKNFTMGWLDLLAIPLSAGINYGMTSALNSQNAKLNHKYWTFQNKTLFEQNEQSADNAMQRSIDLYNKLQSPSAMVQQLKNAGLNPALMYSNGGMGGHTQSGPMGGAQGGQGAPTLGLQNFVDPLTMAQIKNINADTDKKKEEVKNTKQDTALKKSVELLNTQTRGQKEQTFEHELAILIATQALTENEQNLIETKNQMTNKQLKILESEAKLKSYEEELAKAFKEKGWDLGSMTGLGSLFIQMGDKLMKILQKWDIEIPEWMRF